MIIIVEMDRFKAKATMINAKVLREEKVLVLSDLHIPFHREQMILDIILKHRNDITTIIFGGDILDCYSVSSFPKEVRRPLVDEMIEAYKFFARVDRLTPDVKKIFIWGNHEYRFVKYLADNPNELNALHGTNILQNVVGGFAHHDRISLRKTTYPPLSSNFEVVDKWFVQYNDLIVAHPKNYSKIQLRSAVSAVEHFLKTGMNFITFYQGHTHKWGETTHYGVRLGELGCLCKTMEYADTGNTGYSPQEYGYALVAFKDGVTIQDDTRLYRIMLEEEEGDVIWQESEPDLKI